jgi:isoaspartyl peptidase/L-asparaginase-like protein (Ntn-hydrolase superfamily)
MNSRRKFLSNSIFGAGSLLVMDSLLRKKGCRSTQSNPHSKTGFPLVTSTWNFGLQANVEAWKTLENKGSALDAVEAGVMLAESDLTNLTVGLGSMPDRDGRVTLDACVMDWQGRAGSVCFVERIKHPVSLARRVMEKTPHVMLVGEGALQFARSEGFPVEKMGLTDAAAKAWEEWKIKSLYEPQINIENHDTIGMLAIDAEGRMAGACSTGGLAFKMRGRVGDSPIIGAGLYVDGEVGAAVTTGLGETVLRSLTSFLAVELLRQGSSPQEACRLAIERLISKHPNYRDFQVGIIAVNRKGEHGAFGIHPGFNYALYQASKNDLLDAPSYLPKSKE